MVKLISPVNGETVPLLSDYQKRFIAKRREDIGKPIDWLDWKNPDQKLHRSSPLTVKLVFESDINPLTVFLSENSDMSDADSYESVNGAAYFTNLKIGTKYYWKAGDSEIGEFVTEDTVPRLIGIDGLNNIRDIGGWKTLDGKRIKQGCVYRGIEFNCHYNPPKSSLDYVKNKLGIKLDLDIRGDALEDDDTVGPLGPEVEYRVFPLSDYEVQLTDPSKWRSGGAFRMLADKSKYPIYGHCWGGADRTGTLFYILGAVLGVSREDLILDYELTSLSGSGRCSLGTHCHNAFIELSSYGPFEATLQERAEAYLHTLGITDDIIAQLKENLLEDDN